MACATEARAVGTEEGVRAATEGWAQAGGCEEMVEAGVAAEAKAGEDAGQAAGRALKKGAARRLQGKAKGWWEGRNG